MKRLLLAATLLFSCGEPASNKVDGYTWYKAQERSVSYSWIELSFMDLTVMCHTNDPGLLACAYAIADGKCWVYSRFDEETAKRYIPVGRTTLFEHEVWSDRDSRVGHCAGNKHVELHPSLWP